MASPRIRRSDILLGIVVLVAVIMSVVLFLGQLPGLPDNPNGPNISSLQIVDLAQDFKSETLIVFVENKGSQNITLGSGFSVTVNDIDIPLFAGAIDKDVLEPGDIATVDVPFKIVPDISLVVRILSNDNILSEKSINNTNALVKAYSLIVNVLGDSVNRVHKDPDQASYSSGTIVTLTAEAVDNWNFSDWSGDVSGSENPIEVVVDSDIIVNANFVLPPDEVLVRFTQIGLDSSALGTILTVENTPKSIDDFPVTLTMTVDSLLNYDFTESVASNNPGVRFNLRSVTGPESPISITSEVIIMANFDSEFEVVFSTSPGVAEGSVTPSGVQWFDGGEEVQLQAGSSRPEFDFLFWSSTNPQIQFDNINSLSAKVIINGPGNITANYRVPTVMEWIQEPNSVFLGRTQNIVGVLSSPNLNETFKGLNGKTIDLTITAPNGTQIEDSVTTFSLGGGQNGFFTYQFTPDIIGQWSIETQFGGDEIFGASTLGVTTFEVTEIPQFQVSFAQIGIDDGEVMVDYRIDGGPLQVSTVPFEVLVELDSTLEFSYQDVVLVDSQTRYKLDSVNEDSPLVITGSVNIVGTYNTQYRFRFDQSGLDDSAIGTVVTIGEETKTYDDLPYVDWFDSGTTYSFEETVRGGLFARFELQSPIGTFTITEPGSVTGVYEGQFFLEVNSPEGLPATGEGWYNDGETVTSSVNSPVVVSNSPEIIYTATGYEGTGSAPDGDQTSVEFTIDAPSTITWKWRGVAKLYPDAIVDQNIPNTVGSSNHLNCVTDQGNPDSNYIYSDSNSNWFIDYYSLQDPGLTSGVINRVTVHAECKELNGGADGRIYMRLNGVTRYDQFSLTQEWADYSYDRTSKPGGGSWSWNDIEDLQCGIRLRDSGACTLLWVEVEFTV